MTEHGAIIVDSIQQATTRRCPHCGGHFLVAQSGNLAAGRAALGEMARPRIHCQRCGRLTCGRPGCDPSLACLPLEARLEHREGKRTQYDDAIELIAQRGLPIL